MSDVDDERHARIALACAIAPETTTIVREIREKGAVAVARRHARHVDVDAVRAATERAGARVVIPGDREWPTQLSALEDVEPIALWVRGDADLRLTVLRSIGVVGARAATAYGESVCRRWCSDFVEADYSIVSGGAFGIDAAAHRAALDAQGATVCVLACGIDRAYPRAHEALLERIADQGVIVSEMPPGTPVRRGTFLARNRLIPGLTAATLIVEAAARSGTMATAHHALRVGRPLLAVPGAVTASMSAGCLDLIVDGRASLARGAGDVIAAAEGRPVDVLVPQLPLDGLDAIQRAVFEELHRHRGVSVDHVARRTGLTIPAVLAALGGLERAGWADRDSSAGWRVSSASPARALPR